MLADVAGVENRIAIVSEMAFEGEFVGDVAPGGVVLDVDIEFCLAGVRPASDGLVEADVGVRAVVVAYTFGVDCPVVLVGIVGGYAEFAELSQFPYGIDRGGGGSVVEIPLGRNFCSAEGCVAVEVRSC